jgi:hypothetical protein
MPLRHSQAVTLAGNARKNPRNWLCPAVSLQLDANVTIVGVKRGLESAACRVGTRGEQTLADSYLDTPLLVARDCGRNRVGDEPIQRSELDDLLVGRGGARSA